MIPGQVAQFLRHLRRAVHRPEDDALEHLPIPPSQPVHDHVDSAFCRSQLPCHVRRRHPLTFSRQPRGQQLEASLGQFLRRVHGRPLAPRVRVERRPGKRSQPGHRVTGLDRAAPTGFRPSLPRPEESLCRSSTRGVGPARAGKATTRKAAVNRAHSRRFASSNAVGVGQGRGAGRIPAALFLGATTRRRRGLSEPRFLRRNGP